MMTNYEIFKIVWLGAIGLFIALLLFVAVGRVGSNDLKNLVGEEKFAEIIKDNEWGY